MTAAGEGTSMEGWFLLKKRDFATLFTGEHWVRRYFRYNGKTLAICKDEDVRGPACDLHPPPPKQQQQQQQQ